MGLGVCGAAAAGCGSSSRPQVWTATPPPHHPPHCCSSTNSQSRLVPLSLFIRPHAHISRLPRAAVPSAAPSAAADGKSEGSLLSAQLPGSLRSSSSSSSFSRPLALCLFCPGAPGPHRCSKPHPRRLAVMSIFAHPVK